VTYESMALGDVCDFSYGSALPEINRRPGPFPVYGSNGAVGWHNESLTHGPTIIVGRKGSIGRVHYSNRPCFPIDTTYFIKETKLPYDLRWLYYALKSLNLPAMNKAAAVPGLNRNDAYEKRVAFPPLDEQHRIAALLDKADRLRRSRRYVQELSNSFLQSVFLEMFRSKKSHTWTFETIENLAKEGQNAIRTGPFGSQLLHSEFTDHGIAVLGIDNAVQNRFTWDKRRFVSKEKYDQIKRYTVYPGDVLITIMGTCGRCAVVPDNIPLAINSSFR